MIKIACVFVFAIIVLMKQVDFTYEPNTDLASKFGHKHIWSLKTIKNGLIQWIVFFAKNIL